MKAGKLAVALALLSLSACGRPEPSAAAGARPALQLLTPLPLLWSERFTLDQPVSPVIERLEQDYRVMPVDLPSQLPEGGLLLAAQPRALPAEELVALDAWVRRGGRLVLLADPMLEWPSDLPLGDPRRAPLAYPDTGLLRHWGLRLDGPDARGPARRGGGHFPLVFISPGNLTPTAPGCSISRAGIVAECRIGEGTVVIVADADWLNEDLASAHTEYFRNHLSELIGLLESALGEPTG